MDNELSKPLATYKRVCLTKDKGMIGIINASMFGSTTEPGEYVDWSSHDEYVISEFEGMIDQDVATYAQESPHMIVFYIC